MFNTRYRLKKTNIVAGGVIVPTYVRTCIKSIIRTWEPPIQDVYTLHTSGLAESNPLRPWAADKLRQRLRREAWRAGVVERRR